jgi:hypothetical protein
MTITVLQFLSRIALDLQEDPSVFPPGKNNLWSLDEMLDYIDYAERDFLSRTGISKSDIKIVVPPGSSILFSKPAGAMDIERISFDGDRVRRVTAWDLERENRSWRASIIGKPQYYHEDHLPLFGFEFNKIPALGGKLRIFCDTLPNEHTTNLSEPIAVQDIWEPYIRWEVLSLALGKDGDNQDVSRSDYAHQRYLLGVSLAKRFVLGTSIINFPGV